MLTVSRLLLTVPCVSPVYSFQAEHTDLRHVMGVGIAITRGSAASLSFCYSLLLLTMSRNILTMMKNYSIQQYLPIDSHIQFHKIVACTSLFFTVLHSIGHLVNFYHVSTQSLDNLRCLLTEMTFQSDARPGIGYWLFCTLTGMRVQLIFLIESSKKRSLARKAIECHDRFNTCDSMKPVVYDSRMYKVVLFRLPLLFSS